MQLSALIKFVGTNKKQMDEHLRAIAIIVSNPLVRTTHASPPLASLATVAGHSPAVGSASDSAA